MIPINATGFIEGDFFAPSATGLARLRVVTEGGDDATTAVIGHLTALVYRRGDPTARCPDVPSVASAPCVLPDALKIEDFSDALTIGEYKTLWNYGSSAKALGGVFEGVSPNVFSIATSGGLFADRYMTGPVALETYAYFNNSTIQYAATQYYYAVVEIPADVGTGASTSEYVAGYNLFLFWTYGLAEWALSVRDGNLYITTQDGNPPYVRTVTNLGAAAAYLGTPIRALAVYTVLAENVNAKMEFYLGNACETTAMTLVGSATLDEPYSTNMYEAALGVFETGSSGTGDFKIFGAAIDSSATPFLGELP